MRRVFGVLRIVAAGLIVAAIVGQLAHSLANPQPDVPRFLTNFFSFFTILSNALAAIVLVASGWYSLTRRVDPRWSIVALAAVTTYMATTGVVYNLLLRNIELPQGQTLAWSNEILHVWAPLYLVVVWLVSPGSRVLPWRTIWIVVAFPVVWAAYTLIRGAVIGWYPYPFLDPENGGYGRVTVYVFAIAGLIAAASVGIIAINRARTPGKPGS